MVPPLFDGDLENISRIDLTRYLIFKKHGGVHADRDFECLRPHDPLLRQGALLFGAEPASHARLETAVRPGLDPIVCNAWAASVAELTWPPNPVARRALVSLPGWAVPRPSVPVAVVAPEFWASSPRPAERRDTAWT